MTRFVPVCLLGLGLLVQSGCSANPGYAPIFKELVDSLRRSVAAMKSARDTASFKKSSEVLFVETQKIDELRTKLFELGKPNSASIKSVKPYLDEIKALMPEIETASNQYGQTLGRVRISDDERMVYGAMGLDFAQSLQKFDMVARDFK